MAHTSTPAGWGTVGETARSLMEADFLALPLDSITDAAITTARSLGASHADCRISRQSSRDVCLRDGRGQTAATHQVTGIGVRVLVDGVWGFAATEKLTPAAAAEAARTAVCLARVCRPMVSQEVSLADEPVLAPSAWASPFEVDPFSVPEPEVRALLAERSMLALSAANVDHVDATFHAGRDLTHYCDSDGRLVTNQRTRVESGLTAWHVGDDRFEDLATMAPPTARGWEYIANDSHWDWRTECEQMPARLAEKVSAPSIEPGQYDLIIHPTNLWLTIHESVGHATELDRALGYEANYAGTSFATPDQLGLLQYGSALMNVTGDRSAAAGLATTGFDDEGVGAQEWDIIRNGVLVGYQLDRRMAAEQGFGRSNGCAFADSASHFPIQRMPNISLLPDPRGPDLDAMIGEVDDGILILGDKSWSIDMSRYNFQFTGQLFYRIRAGRLAGQCRDVAYRSRTPDFWASLTRVGGPSTYLLGGALNCGKGQPGQVASVSHGAPACRFDAIEIINTAQESHS